jgi:hypothetical protein
LLWKWQWLACNLLHVMALKQFYKVLTEELCFHLAAAAAAAAAAGSHRK